MEMFQEIQGFNEETFIVAHSNTFQVFQYLWMSKVVAQLLANFVIWGFPELTTIAGHVGQSNNTGIIKKNLKKTDVTYFKLGSFAAF